MTDQQRPAGYRGALPARNDALARPWVLIVIGLFLAMFLLAWLGFPTSILPNPSARPSPSFSLTPSASDLVSPPPTE